MITRAALRISSHTLKQSRVASCPILHRPSLSSHARSFWSKPTPPPVEAPAIQPSPPVDPANIPAPTESIAETVTQAATTTSHVLQDYGLGSWWPSGWCQRYLEWMHVTTGLPWYSTIIVSIIVLRLGTFWWVRKGLINNARVAAVTPQVSKYMKQVQQAKAQGNLLDQQDATKKAMKIYKDNQCHPLGGLVLPLIQVPVFASMFFALRGMAEAKLPGFVSGGALWFADLSIPDPYYVLPISSAAATLLVMEIGAEGGTISPQMKNFFRVMPLIIAPVASTFPAAVCLYWTVSNIFSVAQAGLIRIPYFKKLLNIPDRPPPSKEELEMSKDGFLGSFKKTVATFTESHSQKMDQKAMASKILATAPKSGQFVPPPTPVAQSSKTNTASLYEDATETVSEIVDHAGSTPMEKVQKSMQSKLDRKGERNARLASKYQKIADRRFQQVRTYSL